jgi:hypothetical protein
VKSPTSRHLLAVLLSTVLGAESAAVALANPTLGPSTLPETPDTNMPSINIQAPELNKVYNAKSVPYSITVEKPASWIENGTGYLRSVGYIIDEKTNVTIADIFNASISLSVEEPGKLVLTPNADYVDLNSENRSLTVKGNLSGLSEGNHSIQVWVNSISEYHPADVPHDFYGWWAAVAEIPLETLSNVVPFSVTNQVIEPEVEPLPNLLVAAISVTVAAVVASGALVFSKKSKHEAQASGEQQRNQSR